MNEWSYLVVKFTTNYMDDCDIKSAKPRKGKLLAFMLIVDQICCK
jgi:hypothetical protein